ncbi:MAG: carboxymuconolactone decarboxylase family protein [Euzebya sp.]
MSWIQTISRPQAEGRLRQLYDRVAGPDGRVDNILKLHALRPHTLDGHMGLYKRVLHHPGNQLPKATLEMIGVYVSLLNGCDYCVEHHFVGLQRLIGDERRSSMVRTALEAAVGQEPEVDEALSQADVAALRYARELTLRPDQMTQSAVVRLRDAGYDDGRILEINQVVAYFAYANRTVLGLGASIEGDELGLSPGNAEDPDDWSHH